jgi:C4-dicarboxylate-specific signal transduction histidine kinase
VRFSGTHLDITQQKQAQAELEEQRMINVHASRMALLGEMAGGIAHEINSPLAVITMLAAQLSEHLQSNQMDLKRVVNCAKTLESTAFRIARIVTSMKSLTRESSQEPVTRVRLKELVEDAEILVHERFKVHGITLDSSGVDPNFVLSCQPNEISQVLLNLIQNARDAVENTAEKWIRVETREDGKTVQISVVDSGPAIPDSIHSRLFQPFFTTKPLGRGTGLGLGICQRIIERHGGKIEHVAHSHPTRFVFTLPIGVDVTNS